MSHDEVKSAEECRVHFQKTVVATVDANIKLTNTDTNASGESKVAKELRGLLGQSNVIQSAKKMRTKLVL